MPPDVPTNDPFVCPECGAPMAGLDPVAHALSHYPEYLDPAKSGKEAKRNQALIRAGGVPLSAYENMKESGV